MEKSNWQDKIAVITGASSGIGAAIARKLAQQGLNVVLVARRMDRLAQLIKEIREENQIKCSQVEALQADLSQEEERQRVYERVMESHGRADILINNAGLGWYGYGAEMPWVTAWEMLQVNIAAVVHLSLLFLPKMRSQNAGHIINIGSIAGSLPSQGVAVYSATKSFLDSFTTSLFRELQGTRVRLSVVRAGPVHSEFFEKAAERSAGLRIPVERLAVSKEMVAHHVWELIQRPRRVIYVPRFLVAIPWIESNFGWLIDRAGPLLLRWQKRK